MGRGLDILTLEGAQRKTHLSACAAAFQAAFPDWRRPWGAEDFAGFAADPRVLWLEARCDGAFVGLLLARAILDEAELLTLFRAPGSRMGPVGSLLIERLILHFKECEIERIILEVDESNIRAVSLYQRFGFVQVGRRRRYYRPLGAAPRDALILLYDF